MIAWLAANWRSLAIFVLVIVVLLTLADDRKQAAQAAAAQVTVTRLEKQDGALIDSLKSAVKVERHDSVVFVTKWLTRYLQVHDTLLLHQTDTVTVERFVQVADSTIHACQVVLADCEHRASLAERRAAVADSATKAALKLRPNFFQRQEPVVVAAAAVLGAVLEHALVK